MEIKRLNPPRICTACFDEDADTFKQEAVCQIKIAKFTVRLCQKHIRQLVKKLQYS